MISGKRTLRSLGALVLLLSLSAAASAQTLPGAGWYTTATFQNNGAATGTIELQVLLREGTTGPTSTASFTLDPGANKVFFPGLNGASGTVDVSPALPSNFAGSMVVSATQS